MGSSLAGMQKMVNAELTAAKNENESAKASIGKGSTQTSSSTSSATGSTTQSLADLLKQNLAQERNYLSNSRDEIESSNSHLNYNA